MTHLIDARRLIDTFADTDPRMPALVFTLLGVYLDEGPFAFDATALSERLSTTNQAHLNPEIIAALQPDLERYFEPTPQGWIPRRGVLLHDEGRPRRPGSSAASRQERPH